MKLRNRSSGPTKVEIPMAPMIDIVFLLLIFFMLNLKIVSPEGNFNINLPISAPSAAAAELTLPEIKVSMVSD
ncbi:MAG: biopolymer transporter ExbD, partial [Schlesneria sp.]